MPRIVLIGTVPDSTNESHVNANPWAREWASAIQCTAHRTKSWNTDCACRRVVLELYLKPGQRVALVRPTQASTAPSPPHAGLLGVVRPLRANGASLARRAGCGLRLLGLGLYKILFYYEACVHESMLFFANSTFVWAPHFPPSSHTLLRNLCFPSTTLYCNICHTIS